VHLEGASLRLERSTGSGVWEVICIAPCDTSTPALGDFRVNGPDIRSSPRFMLPAGESRLEVQGGSVSRYTTGWVLVAVGALAVGGAAMLARADSPHPTEGSDAAAKAMYDPPDTALPWAIAIPGVLCALLGVALVFDASTTVSVHGRELTSRATDEISFGRGLSLSPRGLSF
ncbi:MAG: hypothetical protein ACHREM_18805, partial [Polyangiales bacterium]